MRCIETSSDNPPIWLPLYALLSSGPPTFEKLLGGRRLRDSFHLSPVQGYRREIMVTAVLMMDSKVARLFFPFSFFDGQYLPSLNTKYLAIDKDMEKRLPQLYYTKMKNCCKQCYILTSASVPSSETQGQIVGARESLNGRKNLARRRKVKNGEKSPWGQCLTRPVPNGRRRSGF